MLRGFFMSAPFNKDLKGFFRIAELATTAERQERTYVTKNGSIRTIKGRAARKGIVPMGETTIWEKVKSGEFPTPIKLSERITAWRIEDIHEWMKSKELGN